MFIGHFGVALAAKRAAPHLSLGTLLLAAQLPDLIWPTLVLLGVETVRIAPGDTAVSPLEFVSYPYSHSLLSAVALGAVFALVVWALARSWTSAAVAWASVVSHWVLDAISHRPDLPLLPGGAGRVGLGLWNSVAGTAALEGLVFAAAVAVYVRATAARDRAGVVGLWAVVALLAAIYVASLGGAPPPSAAAIAWVGQSGWLFVLWGFWLDRHRPTRQRGASVAA